MHVLIYEQEHAGHYLQYVGSLLPALAALAPAVSVTVALTEFAVTTPEYRSFLEPRLSGAAVRTRVPRPPPGMRWRDRGMAYRQFRAVIDELRPDHVLVPSADVLTSAMWLHRLRGCLPRGVEAEAGLHYGPARADSARALAKALVYRTTQTLSGWSRLLFVNPLVVESLGPWKTLMRGRAEILPDPVREVPPLDQRECRRTLGLPAEGRLAVSVGYLDHRKAVPQVLRAFRAAADPRTDYLVFGGEVSPEYARLIETDYADLVRAGRLIVMNRFLTDAEMVAALRAADFVCTPYTEFHNLSSVVLRATAAGRPVLTHDHGWCRTMVERFRLGVACSIHSEGALADAMRTLFRDAPDHRPGEAVRRLLEFHKPDNYARTWLSRIRRRVKAPDASPARTWEWVMEAVR